MNNTRLVCHDCIGLQAEIVVLRKRISLLENMLNERDDLIISLQSCIATQDQENQKLKASIHNLKKEAFGSKSENKNKLNRPATNSNTNPEGKKKKKRKPADRSDSRKIPPNIPRDKVILSLPASEDICPCCGEKLEVIGYKTSEKIDIISAMLKAIQYLRKQYACPKCKCKEAMKLAPLPQENCNNTFATPGFLAWIINNKYNYHLPLYSKHLSKYILY